MLISRNSGLETSRNEDVTAFYVTAEHNSANARLSAQIFSRHFSPLDQDSRNLIRALINSVQHVNILKSHDEFTSFRCTAAPRCVL